MKRSKSFWTLYSVITTLFIPGCTSPPFAVYSNSGGTKLSSYVERREQAYQKKVFSAYCQHGRQIKKLSINIRYISPGAMTGTPIDQVNSQLESISSQKNHFIAGAFNNLSTIGSCDSGVVGRDRSCLNTHRDEIFFKTSDSSKAVTDYAKGVRSDVKIYPSRHMVPVFLVTEKSNQILLFFEWNMPDISGVYNTAWDETEYRGRQFFRKQQAYLADLNALKIGYTMMVPLEVQKDLFYATSGCHKNPGGGFPIQLTCNGYYGYDEEVNPLHLTPTASIHDQSAIWERYFSTFTSVKEATTDDPQMTDYGLSLDLNHFCKYARAIGDLVAQ